MHTESTHELATRIAAVIVSIAVLAALAGPSRALTTSVPQSGNESVHENWIVADGSLLELFKSGSGATPASGSFGFVHVARSGADRPIQQFELYFAAAGTADTVNGNNERAFGASLLPSSVSGHRPSMQLEYLRTKTYNNAADGSWDQSWGFRTYGGISRVTWKFDRSTSPLVSDVTVATGGARFVWMPIHQALSDEEGDNGKQYVALTCEGGITCRYLFFDEDGGDEMRAVALGGEKRILGGELGVALQVREFVASMYLPMFRKGGRDDDIPGLTGAHPQFQFSVRAKLFRLGQKP